MRKPANVVYANVVDLDPDDIIRFMDADPDPEKAKATGGCNGGDGLGVYKLLAVRRIS